MTPELRAAQAQDATAIAALDAHLNPSPWSVDAVRETLAAAQGVVAGRDDGNIDGFVLFALAADQCEILDIAVDPAAQRRGLGARLLGAALAAAVRAGATRCCLEVRASNRGAQAFYRAAGFGEDGRRKAYYRTADGREDALLMSRSIAQGEQRCQP
jgi:[ribosomal protein S18]-alanine N-acetyltransferase